MSDEVIRLSDLVAGRLPKGRVYVFDVFGALLQRVLPQSQVRALVGAYILKHHPCQADPYSVQDVCIARAEIESTLQAEPGHHCGGTSLRLPAVVAALMHKLDVPVDDNQIKEIVDFETALTSASTLLSDGASEALERLQSEGVRIVGLSAHGVEGDLCSMLLADKGVSGYFDAICSPCESCDQDERATWFSNLAGDEDVSPSDMVLITGEDRTASLAHEEWGMHTIVVHSVRTAGRNTADMEFGMRGLHQALNAAMPKAAGKRGLHETACTLALPLMSYIRSIVRYCRRHHINDIYFLSREGLLFKRVFDLVGPTDVKTHYLCVSRVSLFMLTVKELTDSTVDGILDLFEQHSHRQDLSIGQLLYVLKIDHRAATQVVRSCGYDVHQTVPLKEGRKWMREILLDEKMRRLFSEARANYLDRLCQYLRQLGLPDHDRALLCDMGWSGSMQTYLTDILREQGCPVELHGYYFGYDKTIDAKKHGLGSEDTVKSGYFCYDGAPSGRREQEIINNITLEILATAGHGTTVSYRQTGARAVPVFMHYAEEIWQYRQILAPFQQAMIAFAAKYWGLFELVHRVYTEDEMYRYNRDIVHTMIYKPVPEIRPFIAFVFYDDFYGRHMRIPWAPYGGLEGRAGTECEIRRVVCQLVQRLLPQEVLGWMVPKERLVAST